MRINEITEGPHDPYQYKAIFFAGSPGAGKTYVARKLAGVFGGLKQVNMDIIFKHLMTKKNLSWKMPPEEEPEREKQRQRSKELVAKQQQSFADSGLGLLIDSTGRIAGTVRRIKDELEDKGYKTTMVFVTTDLETALRRNKERERTLPDKIIHQNFEIIEQRLGEYQRMFNDVLVIDNSESTQMSMPAQLVHVEKNIRKFLQ
jgi:tRNA uridine 5-carbamoylmethylation protein Kti12